MPTQCLLCAWIARNKTTLSSKGLFVATSPAFAKEKWKRVQTWNTGMALSKTQVEGCAGPAVGAGTHPEYQSTDWSTELLQRTQTPAGPVVGAACPPPKEARSHIQKHTSTQRGKEDLIIATKLLMALSVLRCKEHK
eukprot:1136317-Pelagomonas_calceolata.AAC.5